VLCADMTNRSTVVWNSSQGVRFPEGAGWAGRLRAPGSWSGGKVWVARSCHGERGGRGHPQLDPDPAKGPHSYRRSREGAGSHSNDATGEQGFALAGTETI